MITEPFEPVRTSDDDHIGCGPASDGKRHPTAKVSGLLMVRPRDIRLRAIDCRREFIPDSSARKRLDETGSEDSVGDESPPTRAWALD